MYDEVEEEHLVNNCSKVLVRPDLMASSDGFGLPILWFFRVIRLFFFDH